jgi:hypothetical protein
MIQIDEGDRLREAWTSNANPHCAHIHLAAECTPSGYTTGFYICKRCGAKKSYRRAYAISDAAAKRVRGQRYLWLTIMGILGALSLFRAWSKHTKGSTRTNRPGHISD